MWQLKNLPNKDKKLVLDLAGQLLPNIESFEIDSDFDFVITAIELNLTHLPAQNAAYSLIIKEFIELDTPLVRRVIISSNFLSSLSINGLKEGYAAVLNNDFFISNKENRYLINNAWRNVVANHNVDMLRFILTDSTLPYRPNVYDDCADMFGYACNTSLAVVNYLINELSIDLDNASIKNILNNQNFKYTNEMNDLIKIRTDKTALEENIFKPLNQTKEKLKV